MSEQHPSSGGTPDDPRTPFEKFRDLTRRILTTPKAELMKDERKKAAKPRKTK